MTERQTIAGAYAQIQSHEELCAERYRSIHETLGDLKGLAKWCAGGVAAIAFALIAYLAAQLVTNVQGQRAPVTQAAVK